MKRILLIEDKPEIRNRIGRELERSGYEITPAGNGREGLEKLLGTEPVYDCIVSDITMPEMDGWDLLLHSRRLRNDIPIINISLHRVLDDSSRVRGAWGFWGKTEDPGRLIQTIEKVCFRARQSRKRRKFPRYHITGEITIAHRGKSIRSRLFNISLRGLMFETDGALALDDEFAAECTFQDTRIRLDRLARDWESGNGDGKLTGARIVAIDAWERAILRKILEDHNPRLVGHGS